MVECVDQSPAERLCCEYEVSEVFRDFLIHSPPGTEYVYHAGRTVTGPDGNRIVEAEPAFVACERGIVMLYQRRIPNSDGLFHFIARKRKP